jgi:Xaa-Pro aminopeptidase
MYLDRYSLIIPRWDKYNPNFFYFTKKDIDHCILLISKNEKIIYTNEMNYELCKKELNEKFQIKKMNLKEIKEELKKRNEKYLIDGSIPTYLFLKIRCKNMKIGFNEFKEMREVKEKNEIEKMKEGVIISREIIEKTKVIERYEHEIKNEIIFKTFKRGLNKSFEPIIANSSNAKYPHYNEYKSKVKDYCLIDYGIEFEKYKTDITRCNGKLGKKKEEYETLINLTYEIADSSYAEMKISEFIENVNKLVLKNKLKKFNHSIGHGVGLEVHEFPVLSLKNHKILKENSVIAIEPGQYDTKTGTRYEEMFLVKKNKLKRI